LSIIEICADVECTNTGHDEKNTITSLWGTLKKFQRQFRKQYHYTTHKVLYIHLNIICECIQIFLPVHSKCSH